MGPGLGGPGEMDAPPASDCGGMLQWGRALEGPERSRGGRRTSRMQRFNGAGPWRARRGGLPLLSKNASVASMGPGLGGPGEQPPFAGPRKVAGASMGPGLGGPGEAGCALGADQALQASMGPGLGGPGEIPFGAWRTSPLSCFNGAGPWRARRVSRKHVVRLRTSCFNGAGPWRARRVVGSIEHIYTFRASMGPGLGGPGEIMPQPDGSQQVLRFNGAGPWRARREPAKARRIWYPSGFNGAGPWRARRGSPSGCGSRTSLRFNGAGPWRARRANCSAAGANPPAELQWGRALEGPERACVETC